MGRLASQGRGAPHKHLEKYGEREVALKDFHAVAASPEASLCPCPASLHSGVCGRALCPTSEREPQMAPREAFVMHFTPEPMSQ